MILFLDEDYRKIPCMVEDVWIFEEMFNSIALALSMAHRRLDGREAKKGRWTYYFVGGENEKILLETTNYDTEEIRWAMDCQENYYWLYRLFLEFCQEYRNRNDNKAHIYEKKLGHIIKHYPSKLNNRKPLEFPKPIELYVEMYKDLTKKEKA